MWPAGHRFPTLGLDQGCPTFLFNGPHCKLKYVTGPQNQQNSSIQWKNTWIAIRSVFSWKNTSLVLQETKDLHCNQRLTRILIKGWGRNWGSGGAARKKTLIFAHCSIERDVNRYQQASAVTINNTAYNSKSVADVRCLRAEV